MLFFEGRIDNQIKLHGYRIELADVEANLRALAGVRDAVVLPVLKQGAVDSLAAFVILNERPARSDFQLACELKVQLTERLPAYMIPRKFSFLESFPDERQRQGGPAQAGRGPDMIPYADFLYFGILLYIALPTLLIRRWLGFSRAWVLLATAAMLSSSTGPSPTSCRSPLPRDCGSPAAPRPPAGWRRSGRSGWCSACGLFQWAVAQSFPLG